MGIAAVSVCCLIKRLPSGDYSIALTKDYSIVRRTAGNVALFNATGMRIVGPQIDGYRVYSEAIVGLICQYPDSPSANGYFILDLKTGRVTEGLKQDDWVSLLGRYGIQSRPVLKDARD